MMRKICYVVTIPLTIRSFFIPQLQYLSEHGFDVSVICSDDGKIQSELGTTIHYIPVEIPRGISIGGSIKAIKNLKDIFKREQFDLIQYSTPNAALYASIAAKQVGCSVRNYHLMGLRYLGATGIGRKVLKEIETIACRNSTSIECVSKSNLCMGIEEGLFSKEKATVVWNGSSGGVDLKRFDFTKRCEWRKKVRSQLGYSDSDFIYGFVGRITRDKGINELLEAFGSLENSSKLLLIGPMEGMKTLNQNYLNEAKKNKNIIFHDVVTDIERYYAAIDVLVLPSYREGFGNVVIEAAAVGTPAIVSNIPGPIDTIIQDRTALTVSVKDVEDLRRKMELIHLQDYKQIGKDAFAYVAGSFDSKKLNAYILNRKEMLLQK